MPCELDAWLNVCLNVIGRHCTGQGRGGEGERAGEGCDAMGLLSVCRARGAMGGALVPVMCETALTDDLNGDAT